MTISNAMLVRTAYGWDEAVDDASIAVNGRREVLYSLGAFNSPADVAEVSAARLAIIGVPRYQWDVEHVAQSLAQLAYHGYESGDLVNVSDPQLFEDTTERVTTIDVSMDSPSGQASVVVTLRDDISWAGTVESFLAGVSRAAQKMIPGTGHGDWLEAQPATPPLVATPVVPFVGALPSPESPDLLVWLKANDDATIQASGSTVTGITDKSSYGNDYQPAGGGSFLSTGTRAQNGQNVIDSAGGGIVPVAGTITGSTDGKQFTVYMVYVSDASDALLWQVIDNFGCAVDLNCLDSISSLEVLGHCGASTGSDDSVGGSSGTFLMRYRQIAAQSYELYVHGVGTFTGARGPDTGGGTSLTHANLMSTGLPTAYNGALAEFMLWQPGTMDATVDSIIMDRLTREWGV